MQLNLHRFAEVRTITTKLTVDSKEAVANIKKISTGVKAVTTELHNMSVGMKTGADEKQLEKYGNRLDYLKKRISGMRTELEKSYGTKGYDKVVKDLTNIEKEYNKVLNLHKTGGLDLSVSPSGMSSSIKQLQFLRNTITAIQNINREKGLSFDTSALKETGVFQTLPQSLQDILTKIESINNATEKNPEVVKKITNSLKDNENALKKVSAAEKALTDAENQNTNANNNNNNSHKKNQNTLIKYPKLLEGVRKGFQGLTLVRLNYLFNTVRRGSGIVKEMVTTAADYQESLNLYNAALGSYVDEATKWADELTNKLFIDPSAIRQYTGTFYNLSKGLGVAREDAFLMSKTLTQLTYDMSSYLNIDIESANEKLISAMSGQARAIQGVGVAIQMASLETTAEQLGIKKSVSEMTQAEKTYLRYIQILKSTTQMQGDLGATLNTPTNAMRALSNQIKQLARALGNILIPIVSRIMPYLMALTDVLTEAAQAVADFFGFEITPVNYEGLEWGADALEDYGDAAEDAGKKIKNSLAPFDELNVVSSSSGKGGSGSGGSVIPQLAKEIGTYDMLSRYTDQFKDQVAEIKEQIEDLLPIIGSIVAAFAFGKLTEGLFGIGKAIKDYITDPAKLAATGVSIMITGFGLVADSVLRTNSELEKTIGYITSIGGGALAGAAIGGKVGGVTGGIIGGLLGALVGGIGAAFTEAETKKLALEKWYDDEEKRAQKLKDELGDIVSGYKAIEDEYNGKLSELAKNENWLTKLKEITDETGHIKSGYEGVAQTIVDQLNKAFGLEIQIQDGKIQNYDTEIQKIQDVIDKKKQQLTLEYGEKAYNESKKEKNDLYDKMIERSNAYNDSQSDLNTELEKEQAIKNKINKLEEKAKLFPDHAKEYEYSLKLLNKKLKEQQIETDKVRTTNDDNKKALDDATFAYQKNIGYLEAYEGLMTNQSQNNAEAVKYYSDLVDMYMSDNVKNVIDNFDSELEEAEKYQKTYLDNVAKTGKEATETQKIYAEQQYKELAFNLARQSTAVEEFTPEAKEAWVKLATASSDAFISGLQYLDDDTKAEVLNAVKEAGVEISPEIQKAIDSTPSPEVTVTSNKQTLFNSIQSVLGMGFAIAVNNIDVSNSALNKLRTTLSSKFSGIFNWLTGGKADGGMYVNGIWKPITAYASGGTPDTGQMFIAREAGPELVGRIGNNTAVVNNDQIVASVAKGVYDAVVAANSGNNQPHTTNVYVGNEKLYSGQGEYQNREADRYGTSTIMI